MPSIHVGRASGNSRKKPEAEAEKPQAPTANDVVANIMAAQRANNPAGTVPVGMPGSDPFTS